MLSILTRLLLSGKVLNFNPLSNDKFLDWFELKELADNKINVTEKLKFVLGRKHCRKRRKCWLPAFSLFPTMFSKGFFPNVVKSQDNEVKI